MDKTNEKIKDYCTKCRQRKSCKTACRFVDLILKKDNRQVMEQHGKDFIINYPPNGRLTRFSEIESFDFEYPEADYAEEASAEFKNVPKERNQSSVFFKRFFQRRSYQDIAEELGITILTARSHYKDAKQHIEKILAMMERKRFAMESYCNLENNLSKEQIWFLMVRAWGLTVDEVREIWPDKYTHDYILTLINQVGRGEFVSVLQRQEKALEAIGERKNRLPKEQVWFIMTQVWGLTIPEVQAIWPRKYSKHYISRMIGELKKAA